MAHEIELNYQDINYAIVYNYQEGEDMVMYHSDMSGHPGSPPEIEFESLTLVDSDVELYEVLLYSIIEGIERELLKLHE